MITRRATCACGQLSVTCEGEPVRVSICHCFECQKRTGSVFATQARFADGHVTIEGRASQFKRTGDSGGTATFRFCPDCGSTVFWSIDRIPGHYAVAVGAFADLQFPAPQLSVYEARQHWWTKMPLLDVEHMD